MIIEQDLDTLARTIYGEARGEYEQSEGGLAALIAVGNVVVNRFKQQTWFGKTIREVCLKPWQFSCWNAVDPNHIIIKPRIIDHPIFYICQEIAHGVACGNWPDLTKGSDHYHSVRMAIPPSWARQKTPLIRVGHHVFYRLQGDNV